eukprot:1153012-Pelagomonas_calceolata.AAC.2
MHVQEAYMCSIHVQEAGAWSCKSTHVQEAEMCRRHVQEACPGSRYRKHECAKSTHVQEAGPCAISKNKTRFKGRLLSRRGAGVVKLKHDAAQLRKAEVM